MDDLQSKNARALRVLIAKDVIKQLETKEIIAKTGMFVGWSNKVNIVLDEPLAKQLQTEETCGVCAKGAAFVALVNRFDNLSGRDAVYEEYVKGTSVKVWQLNTTNIHKYLHKYFDKFNLNEIESAFELWSSGRQVNEHYDGYLDRAQRHLDRAQRHLFDFNSLPIGTPAQRMKTIMMNVIKNDGYFDANEYILYVKKNGYEDVV